MESTPIKQLAMNEFFEVISDFVLPLIDVRGNPKMKEADVYTEELVSFVTNGNGKNCYRIFPCVCSREPQSTAPYYCEVGTYSTTASKKKLEAIVRELLKVTEYNCFQNRIRKQRNYGTKSCRHETYKYKTLQLAFEIGMCAWLTSTYEDATMLHSVVSKMQDWASRTYEGKNVPFGLVMDFDKTSDEDSASYLQFLDNDSSAVFSDGIFSGILLDKAGKLVSFLTRNTPAEDSTYDLFVPYQFADIAKHCNHRAVGIIVLTNGEILLIKNRAVCFVKRGSKWICFDWERVCNSLYPYFALRPANRDTIIQDIKEIYCTLLDVSFSHTGGCLAIVIPSINDDDISKIIKDRFDLTLAGETPEGMGAESKEKIAILKHLLTDGHNGVRPFFKIEKPLRKEILSLDGATVVSLDGSFYCAGSIVTITQTGSGGGRSAAAKRLSQLGVGIKISEDGYIEAYGAEIEANERTTGRLRPIQLFKIK